MKSLLAAVCVAVGLLVGGCATTSGNSALTNKEAVKSIQINKTTKEDISRMFGAPSGQSRRVDGETWTYAYSSVSVVPFFNSADMRQLNVTFDKRGVVTGYDTIKNGY